MNSHKTLAGAVIACAGCLCYLLLSAGCSSEPVGGAAHLPVYHQDPNQPVPSDQAAANMARRHYGVSSAATTAAKP